MRSFTLSAIATLAFGLFCSAAPTPVAIPQARGVDVSSGDGKCLDGILNDVVNSITPIANEIYNLKAEDATVECLTPYLKEIKVIIDGAVCDIKEIPLEEALVSIVKGVILDVDIIVKCLSAVLHVVFLLLKFILGLVGALVWHEILPLVVAIVCSVADLLAAVLALVGKELVGIIACLLPLIQDIVEFILFLGVDVIIKILCI